MKYWILLSLVAGSVLADEQPRFRPGQLLPEHGMIAAVPGHEPIPEHTQFKVSFDVAKAAPPDEVNRHLMSGARFLNMHHATGVSAERMELAFVIHGSAVKDVTNQANKAQAELVQALIQAGVSIQVCGQSAAYYGVNQKDLLPGVKMALSAMTAHALLQQDGYTLNPF